MPTLAVSRLSLPLLALPPSVVVGAEAGAEAAAQLRQHLAK